MPDADPPKNMDYYARRIAAAEQADLPRWIREARHTLGEAEWAKLADKISKDIDGPGHALLLPLVTAREGPFDWVLESFYAEVLAKLDLETSAMLQLMREALGTRPADDHWTILRGFESWAGNPADRPDASIDALVTGTAPSELLAPALRAGLAVRRKHFRDRGLALIDTGPEPFAIAAAEVIAGQKPIGKGAAKMILKAIRQRCKTIGGAARTRLFEAALGLALRTAPDAVAGILGLVDPAQPEPFHRACARQLVVADSAPEATVIAMIGDVLLQAERLDTPTMKFLDDAIRRWIRVESSHAAFADLLVGLIFGTEATFDTLDASAGAVLQLEVPRRDAILARLLAGDTFEGAQAVYQIALKTFGKPLEPVLDFAPHALEPERAIRIARRVAGLFAITPVAATSILLSLLRSGPAEAADEVTGLIMDPVLISYWEDAGDFLRKRREHEIGDMAVRIDTLIAALDGYVEAIRAVGYVEELFPPERQRFLRALKKDADSRAVSRKANEGSLLASLMETRVVLNGDSAIYRVFTGDGESHRAEQPMQAIEHSQALPRLDAIDPFGYWYRRRLLMNGLPA